MSYAHSANVVVITDGAGAATAYSPVMSGRLSAIHYAKTDFTDGVTVTITSEATGQTIWTEAAVNASAHRAPRQATHNSDGSAAVFAALGSPVLDKFVMADDRFKIVISGGGAEKVGAFLFVME